MQLYKLSHSICALHTEWRVEEVSIYGLQGQDFIAVDKQPQPLLWAGTMRNKAFINSNFNPQFKK